MTSYSIKDLEQLSGIKAHTIRIWERRYNVIEPQRTDTNIRFYTDHDLKRLLNISILNDRGFKISKIAAFGDQELLSKVFELSKSPTDYPVQIERLIHSMIDLDESGFNGVLSDLSLKIGFEDTVINVLYPFLERIGILWVTANIDPAQEHFISNLIRQKLIVAIDALPVPDPGKSKKAVLFLREEELHELTLLFQNYLMRKNGLFTIYLGQTVPRIDLLKVYKSYKPQILVTSIISTSSSENPLDYVRFIIKTFPEAQLIISGGAVKDEIHNLPPQSKFAGSAKDFKQIISSV